MPVKKKLVKKKLAARPIAVITADTHLHPTTWANRPTLRGDAFYAFSQICDYCLEHLIHHIIIAGDVLDRRVNDAETPGFIRAALQECRRQRTDVYYVQGQHDLQTGRDPWLNSLSNWPVHLHGESYSLEDFRMYGLDWTRPSEMEEALASIPKDTDIVVMHQVCTEFMGGVRDCELTCLTVPHAKLLIMGDYHVHEKKTLRMADGRKAILVSPGSTCMQKIDEEPAKHFFVLYSDMTVKSQPIKGRRVLSAGRMLTDDAVASFVAGVEAAIAGATERAVKDELPDELLKPILRVEYSEDLEGAGRRIRRAVDSLAFVFEKQLVSDRQENTGEIMTGKDARQLMAQTGLSGFLPRVLDRKREKKLFAFCAELLDSPEPLEVIQAWRNNANLAEEETDG